MKNTPPPQSLEISFSQLKHLILAILISLFTFSGHAQGLGFSYGTSDYAGYNISCHGASDGYIDISIFGGLPPYSVSWSNSATTASISSLTAGDYTATVTDSLDSTFVYMITITEPDPLSLSLEAHDYGSGFNISVHGSGDGSIEAEPNGGNPPYSYQWSTSANTRTISDLQKGKFILTITDIGDCQLTDSVTLIEPDSLLIASISSPVHNGYNVSCHGGNNGAINLSVSGGAPPYTYQWNNGNFVEDISSLTAGQYSVIVSDAIGVARDTAHITLTQPNSLTITTTPVVYPNGENVSCFDCFNGKITASVSGGISPFTYLWSTGETISMIDTLSGGDYVVTVTDVNSCTSSKTQHLTEPDREDWNMKGNDGIDTTKFLGTKDSSDLVFKSSNVERLRITDAGELKVTGLSGTGNTLMVVDEKGVLSRGGQFDPNDLPTLCYLKNTLPWYKAPTTGPSGLHDIVNCQQRFGFGILAPLERVHVAGFARFSHNGGTSDYLNIGHDGSAKINSYGSRLLINDGSSQNVTLCEGGGVVSIGHVTPSAGVYRLFVRGGIRTETVRVDVADLNSWSDYVFDKDYKLLSIFELEKYISSKKHLPGIPSADEVVKNGIDLAEIDAKLLAKIEELTLYIIEQNNRINQLERKIDGK